MTRNNKKGQKTINHERMGKRVLRKTKERKIKDKKDKKDKK